MLVNLAFIANSGFSESNRYLYEASIQSSPYPSQVFDEETSIHLFMYAKTIVVQKSSSNYVRQMRKGKMTITLKRRFSKLKFLRS